MNSEDKRCDSFNYYQSANAQPDAVKANFLVRQFEYSVILEDLFRHPGKGSVQHYLILGRRGSGKSTLLRRIQVEIDTDKKLSSNYIALNLAEEQANIYRLFDLLEEIVKELESQGYDITWPSSSNAATYSNELLSVIHEALQSVEKKLVLLMDNIDRVFENLGDDAAMLRAYLQNFGDIKIIGGSTRMTEHFWAYDQPFYEFFRVLRLQPLDREEVRNLLSSWGEKLNTPLLKEFVEKRPGQLETVRILTDGLPRTLQFFVNILLTQEPQTGYDYVRQIMDKVTPLYQERLNHLPPAQRKIVLQLAFCWESVGAGELAKAARMENRVVSAQLNQLIDKDVVDKIETGTKNHLYRLSERFFNLWLIFTQGSPREKRRAKYLSIFLENFYDAEELLERAKQHYLSLHENLMTSDKAVLLTKAYSLVSCIPSFLRDFLIEKTRELPGVNFQLKNELPPTISEIADEVFSLIEKREWVRAETLIKSIEQDDGTKEFYLGYVEFTRDRVAVAIESLLTALTKGATVATLLLSVIYYNQGDFDLAEKYAETSFQEDNFGASAILGSTYYRLNKNREMALNLMEQAIKEEFQQDLVSSMLPIIQAWNGRFNDMEDSMRALMQTESKRLEYTLMGLLVHHQDQFVRELLEQGGSKTHANIMLLIWFVVEEMAGKDNFKRIPPELAGTIDRILLDIYKSRDFYYGTREATEYQNRRKLYFAEHPGIGES